MRIATNVDLERISGEDVYAADFYVEPSSESGLLVVEAAPDPEQSDDRGHLIVASKAMIDRASDEQFDMAAERIKLGEAELAAEGFFRFKDGDSGAAFELNEGVVLRVLQRGEEELFAEDPGENPGTLFRGANVHPALLEGSRHFLGSHGLALDVYAGAVIREYAPVMLGKPAEV